jgi:hypothetical protein
MNSSLQSIELFPLIFALIILLSCVSFYFWRRSSDFEIKLDTQRSDFEMKLETQRKAMEERQEHHVRMTVKNLEEIYQKRFDELKASTLSVVVHPFVNTQADNGVILKSIKVEVGYKYQLFVQGFPCFEPHTFIVESTTHKEVDQVMLDIFKQIAQDAAEAAVMLPNGFQAKTLFKVAKTTINSVRG